MSDQAGAMDEIEPYPSDVEPVSEPDELVPDDVEPSLEPWPAATTPPGLLAELSVIDETIAVPRADAPDVEEDDDDAPVAGRHRMRTSTKVVLVAGAWLLLTLFLVGRFSNDPPAPSAAHLDSVAGVSGADEDVTEELTEEEVAEADANGDGIVTAAEAAEAGFATATGDTAQGAEAGPSTGGGGVYPGTPTDGSGGVGSGGALPGPAPGGSTTTTTSGTTATTTGSGGGGPTTTTKPGPTTTAQPTPTTTSTTTGSPIDATITITGTPGTGFAYDSPSLTVSAGSRVRMRNLSNRDHTWKIGTNTAIPVDKTKTTEYQLFDVAGTYDYVCTIHSTMTGTITVT